MLAEVAVSRADPALEKRAATKARKSETERTLAALAAGYVADGARRKRPRTLEIERWLLDKYILPRLGQRLFAELKRAEIIAMIEAIGDSAGPVTANRAHAITCQVLNFALKRELIEACSARR